MRNRTLFCATILMTAINLFAADYYVATTGSDGNPGTWANPFATIQKAANVMSAGDTCHIRGGIYHEAVVINGLNGSSGSPITFTAYNNEVVTLDGTQTLSDLGSSGWTLHSGNIYKTTLSSDIWQLFDEGEMMIMARWPNAFLHDDTIWDQQGTWGRGHDDSSSNGTMVDNVNNGHDLAATGLDMSGAMGVMNTGSFRTWARKITSHSAGSDTFNYTATPNYFAKLGYYYVECKLNLLDAAREWFYDSSSNELYLWAPDGAIPSGNIRGKTQTYAFDFFNCDYMVLSGLNFYGTTFNFVDSSSCEVENCNLQFPSFSKRMLGSEADIEFANMQAPNNSWPGNTLRNCVFEHSDGQAIRMKGAGCVIENNYFHNIDYSCAGLPNLGNTIQVEAGSSGALIRRNTIDTAGASEAIAPGKVGTVEYNRITNVGKLQSDGAGIHRMIGEAPNSITRYNWLHDIAKYSIRFDGNPAGQQGLVHHNAVWNSDTMRLKGDQHQVYNNFGFGGVGNKGIINIATDKGGNANSTTRNNAADNISPATLLPAGDPLPGTESHNWNGSWTGTDIRDQVRDAENWDFRPQAGSALVDAGTVISGITDGYLGAAPDIGAYEYGASSYWIAGRQEAAASTPVPPNGSTMVKSDADLMWLEGYQATSHDVYFGTSAGSLIFQGNQSNNIFDPGMLAGNTVYYWRVDAVTPTGTVTGSVMAFSTSATFTPVDQFADWSAGYSLGSQTGRLDNADGDLFNNLVEYALGGAPDDPGDVAAISPTFENMKFVYRRRTDAATRKLTYTLEDCTNLVSGSWSAIFAAPSGTAPLEAGFEAVTNQIATTDAHRFIRLRIEIDGSQPPAFSADPFSKASGTVNAAYSDSIAGDASDPESNPLSFLKLSGPAWLSVASNGTLSGTPGVGDMGVNAFTVQVNATGGGDIATLNITVVANQPPAFTADPFSKANGVKNAAYGGSIAGAASDPESDLLTFSKISGPAWLSVASNGALSGTPGAGDVGLNTFTVQVNATGGSDTATLNITVDAVGGMPTGYPAATGNDVSDEWIGRVQFGTIDQPSGADGGYADRTTVSAHVSAGSSHTMTVTYTYAGSTYSEDLNVWIDFNRDGDFADAGEHCLTVDNQQNSASGSITIPLSASLGETRMRIAMSYAPQAGLSNAGSGSFTYGEVEDYKLVIQ